MIYVVISYATRYYVLSNYKEGIDCKGICINRDSDSGFVCSNTDSRGDSACLLIWVIVD